MFFDYGTGKSSIGTCIKSYSRQLCLIGIVFSVQFYYGCNGVSLLVLVPFNLNIGMID